MAVPGASAPGSTLLPEGEDGLRGVRFVAAAVASSADGMRWIDL
jgi:hypothetical protein